MPQSSKRLSCAHLKSVRTVCDRSSRILYVSQVAASTRSRGCRLPPAVSASNAAGTWPPHRPDSLIARLAEASFLNVAGHVGRKAEMYFPIANTLSSRRCTSPRRLETMRDLCCSVDIARRLVVFGAKLPLQGAVLYSSLAALPHSTLFRTGGRHSLPASRPTAELVAHRAADCR